MSHWLQSVRYEESLDRRHLLRTNWPQLMTLIVNGGELVWMVEGGQPDQETITDGYYWRECDGYVGEPVEVDECIQVKEQEK